MKLKKIFAILTLSFYSTACLAQTFEEWFSSLNAESQAYLNVQPVGNVRELFKIWPDIGPERDSLFTVANDLKLKGFLERNESEIGGLFVPGASNVLSLFLQAKEGHLSLDDILGAVGLLREDHVDGESTKDSTEKNSTEKPRKVKLAADAVPFTPSCGTATVPSRAPFVASSGMETQSIPPYAQPGRGGYGYPSSSIPPQAPVYGMPNMGCDMSQVAPLPCVYGPAAPVYPLHGSAPVPWSYPAYASPLHLSYPGYGQAPPGYMLTAPENSVVSVPLEYGPVIPHQGQKGNRKPRKSLKRRAHRGEPADSIPVPSVSQGEGASVPHSSVAPTQRGGVTNPPAPSFPPTAIGDVPVSAPFRAALLTERVSEDLSGGKASPRRPQVDKPLSGENGGQSPKGRVKKTLEGIEKDCRDLVDEELQVLSGGAAAEKKRGKPTPVAAPRLKMNYASVLRAAPASGKDLHVVAAPAPSAFLASEGALHEDGGSTETFSAPSADTHSPVRKKKEGLAQSKRQGDRLSVRNETTDRSKGNEPSRHESDQKNGRVIAMKEVSAAKPKPKSRSRRKNGQQGANARNGVVTETIKGSSQRASRHLPPSSSPKPSGSTMARHSERQALNPFFLLADADEVLNEGAGEMTAVKESQGLDGLGEFSENGGEVDAHDGSSSRDVTDPQSSARAAPPKQSKKKKKHGKKKKREKKGGSTTEKSDDWDKVLAEFAASEASRPQVKPTKPAESDFNSDPLIKKLRAEFSGLGRGEFERHRKKEILRLILERKEELKKIGSASKSGEVSAAPARIPALSVPFASLRQVTALAPEVPAVRPESSLPITERTIMDISYAETSAEEMTKRAEIEDQRLDSLLQEQKDFEGEAAGRLRRTAAVVHEEDSKVDDAPSVSFVLKAMTKDEQSEFLFNHRAFVFPAPLLPELFEGIEQAFLTTSYVPETNIEGAIGALFEGRRSLEGEFLVEDVIGGLQKRNTHAFLDLRAIFNQRLTPAQREKATALGLEYLETGLLLGLHEWAALTSFARGEELLDGLDAVRQLFYDRSAITALLVAPESRAPKRLAFLSLGVLDAIYSSCNALGIRDFMDDPVTNLFVAPSLLHYKSRDEAVQNRVEALKIRSLSPYFWPQGMISWASMRDLHQITRIPVTYFGERVEGADPEEKVLLAAEVAVEDAGEGETDFVTVTLAANLIPAVSMQPLADIVNTAFLEAIKIPGDKRPGPITVPSFGALSTYRNAEHSLLPQMFSSLKTGFPELGFMENHLKFLTLVWRCIAFEQMKFAMQEERSLIEEEKTGVKDYIEKMLPGVDTSPLKTIRDAQVLCGASAEAVACMISFYRDVVDKMERANIYWKSLSESERTEDRRIVNVPPTSLFPWGLQFKLPIGVEPQPDLKFMLPEDIGTNPGKASAFMALLEASMEASAAIKKEEGSAKAEGRSLAPGSSRFAMFEKTKQTILDLNFTEYPLIQWLRYKETVPVSTFEGRTAWAGHEKGFMYFEVGDGIYAPVDFARLVHPKALIFAMGRMYANSEPLEIEPATAESAKELKDLQGRLDSLRAEFKEFADQFAEARSLTLQLKSYSTLLVLFNFELRESFLASAGHEGRPYGTKQGPLENAIDLIKRPFNFAEELTPPNLAAARSFVEEMVSATHHGLIWANLLIDRCNAAEFLKRKEAISASGYVHVPGVPSLGLPGCYIHHNPNLGNAVREVAASRKEAKGEDE